MENHTYDILYLFIVPLSILTLTTFFLRRHHRKPPYQQQSYPLIGNIIAFLVNRHRFHDWVTDMLSTNPTLTLKVNGFLNLSKGTNFENYIKGSRYTDVLDELLGGGIFNSNGHAWSVQRKIASHEFNSKSLRCFISDTVELQVGKSLIPRLLSAVDSGETIDLQQVLRKFTFDNICKVAFGVDPGSSHSNDANSMSFMQAFDVAVEHTFNRFMTKVQCRTFII